MKNNGLERSNETMKKTATWVIAAVLAVAMTFTAVPVNTDAAYAADGTVIKTSEITEDMLTIENCLELEQDTILYIDKNIDLTGIDATDDYDLIFRGDGEHQLRIVSYISGNYAIRGKDISVESGNIGIAVEKGNYVKAAHDFYIKGGDVAAYTSVEKAFTISNDFVVSGGCFDLRDAGPEGKTAAVKCKNMKMTDGMVEIDAKSNIALWVENSEISGGRIDLAAKAWPLEADDAFSMTGGYIHAKCTGTEYGPLALLFNGDEPVLGNAVCITIPENGKVEVCETPFSSYYYIVNKNGDDATEVLLQTKFSSTTVSLGTKTYTYNGKKRTPAVTVKFNGKKLTEHWDYTVAYPEGCVNAGTYSVKVTGRDIYTSDTKTVTFTITKAKNPLAVTGRTATVKYSKVKKAAQKLTVSKVLKTTKKGQGTVTYTKSKGNKKITIAKKTGKVTVKKGLKKGTYTVKVKIKAAGTRNYKALTKTVTFKIKVK